LIKETNEVLFQEKERVTKEFAKQIMEMINEVALKDQHIEILNHDLDRLKLALSEQSRNNESDRKKQLGKSYSQDNQTFTIINEMQSFPSVQTFKPEQIRIVTEESLL
jgi:hypothetical protein